MKRLFLAAALALVFVSPAQADKWTVPSDLSPWLPQSDACLSLDPNRATWWIPCVGTVPDPTVPFHVLPGYLLSGRMDAWVGAPDFFFGAEERHWGETSPLDHDGSA